MDNMKHILACDCGNSSVRVVLCCFDGQKITTEVVLQEPNEMVRVGNYHYWDMLQIFKLMKQGIQKAVEMVPRVDSIGICTWGVDFALFDAEGFMLGAPLSYRNTMGAQQLAALPEGEREAMFYRTGILCDKINSVFMLKGMQQVMPSLMGAAKKILMVPDILNYYLTGIMQNEPSELSTTQLLDSRTLQISPEQCAALGVDKSWFGKISRHGVKIGNLMPEICEELGLSYQIPVVCVPSHDTACAALGTPSVEKEFAFISSGTWALIGMQCKKPIVTKAVYDAGLTNEVGAFGYTTLLKNSMGMFLLQQLRQQWMEQAGRQIGWNALMDIAAEYTGEAALFDINHPTLFSPSNMLAAIEQLAALKGQSKPEANLGWSGALHATQLSLAAGYADGMQKLSAATGRSWNEIIVVGGGARNHAINQACANMSGIPVIACSQECASIGNAAAQLACLCPALSYPQLRGIIYASLTTVRYHPQENWSWMLERYQRIIN